MVQVHCDKVQVVWLQYIRSSSSKLLHASVTFSRKTNSLLFAWGTTSKYRNICPKFIFKILLTFLWNFGWPQKQFLAQKAWKSYIYDKRAKLGLCEVSSPTNFPLQTYIKHILFQGFHNLKHFQSFSKTMLVHIISTGTRKII